MRFSQEKNFENMFKIGEACVSDDKTAKNSGSYVILSFFPKFLADRLEKPTREGSKQNRKFENENWKLKMPSQWWIQVAIFTI